MKLSIKSNKWKRYFSVPCALTDEYLRLADAAALKVFLYLLSSEADENDENDIINATGISKAQLDDAVAFWNQFGIIETDSVGTLFVLKTTSEVKKDVTPEKTVTKIVHAHYNSAEIAKMLESDTDMRHLFDEASTTLGRILKHSDHEMIISLKDYFGFSPMAIIAILAYCVNLDKTSARYIEGVAKGLFDKGITEFKDIESEFERLNEIHSFENIIKQAFGLSAKLTPKQKSYIEAWKEAGFSIELINLACETCIDSINKVYFPYIDKVLSSWADKNITTVEQVSSENNKPVTAQRIEKTHSFDLDDFDKLTLGISDDKKQQK